MFFIKVVIWSFIFEVVIFDFFRYKLKENMLGYDFILVVYFLFFLFVLYVNLFVLLFEMGIEF